MGQPLKWPFHSNLEKCTVVKGGSGLDLIRALRTRQSMLPVLVVSKHDESLYVERALRAGARGYIMKHEATDIMMSAIRRVLRGEIYVSDKMMTKLLGRLSQATLSTPIRPFSNGSAIANWKSFG